MAKRKKTFFFHPSVYCSGSILVQAAAAHETIDNALGERKKEKEDEESFPGPANRFFSYSRGILRERCGRAS